MVIKGMDDFQKVCREKLTKWYNKSYPNIEFNFDNTFIVWSVKTLQNYKCLVSTTVDYDGIYAEYTYNGDKEELYEDVYKKLTNRCIK